MLFKGAMISHISKPQYLFVKVEAHASRLLPRLLDEVPGRVHKLLLHAGLDQDGGVDATDDARHDCCDRELSNLFGENVELNYRLKEILWALKTDLIE